MPAERPAFFLPSGAKCGNVFIQSQKGIAAGEVADHAVNLADQAAILPELAMRNWI